MKTNSNKTHMVISLLDDGKGIEIIEDLAGTLPELTSLLTYYIVHFCHTMAKKKQTVDGDKFDAGTILIGIIIASLKSINEPLEEDELDE